MRASKKPRSRGDGLRVLLVEDEIMVALLLEEMLNELGHTVVGPIARLNKALEVVQREMLDAAILDVNVNGEEVYPVANALASRNIPFAFATGYGKMGLRVPYRDRPTLPKPFQLRQLVELLSEMRCVKQE